MYQLQIKENNTHWLIGYFDPKLKDQPATIAFRVIITLRKEFNSPSQTKQTALNLAISDEQKRYKW